MIYDVLIIGAGAAGLFCGSQAGLRGLSTLVLDHSKKPAEKVRISGGGRCNFTNIHTTAQSFLSQNPHYCKSALARYTPHDFMDHLARHGLTWHEKTLGQLFCDQKSAAIIQMLLDDLRETGGQLYLETPVKSVSKKQDLFDVQTSRGVYAARNLVVATGGLSIPKMGATGFAYDLAAQFGHGLVKPEPALVPLIFQGQDSADFASISGVSCPVVARVGSATFEEALLFTHRGLSGPAVLQISSYWSSGDPIHLDFFAGQPASTILKDLKATYPRKSLSAALEGLWPKRLIELFAKRGQLADIKRLADASHAQLDDVARLFSAWAIKPSGTEGWRTAEVTKGGIDTQELSSKSMESKRVSNLYFIGECVDVTGWLGGYNFQWAWASAHAAAEHIAKQTLAP